EFGDILVYRMTFQRQQFALIFSGTLLVNFMKQAHRAFIAAVFQTAADRHVLSDGKVGEKTVIPAAFSDVSHPFFHGIQGGTWRDIFAIKTDFSASAFINAKQTIHQFSTSGTDQPGKA